MATWVRGLPLVVVMLAAGCATTGPAKTSHEDERPVALAIEYVGALPSQIDASLIMAMSPSIRGRSKLLLASDHSISTGYSLVGVTIDAKGVTVEAPIAVSLPDHPAHWQWDNTGCFVTRGIDCASISLDGTVRLRPHIETWQRASGKVYSYWVQSITLLSPSSELVMLGPSRWWGETDGRVLLGYFVDGRLVSSAVCKGMLFEYESTGMYARGEFVAVKDGSWLALLPGGSIWRWNIGQAPKLIAQVPGNTSEPAMSMRWMWSCEAGEGKAKWLAGDTRRWHGLNGKGEVVASLSTLESNGTNWAFISGRARGILAVGRYVASRDGSGYVITAMYHELESGREVIVKGALSDELGYVDTVAANVDDTGNGITLVTTNGKVFRVVVRRLCE